MSDRSNKLEQMLEMQSHMQLSMRPLYTRPELLEGAERVQFVKDMVMALEDELHEALDEISWKPWAKAEFFNEPQFKGELIDAFHFFMNLWLTAGGDADELFDRYKAKAQINLERQANNYDGVTTKCPTCGRALDDPEVTCTKDVCSSWGTV